MKECSSVESRRLMMVSVSLADNRGYDSALVEERWHCRLCSKLRW